jgi:hypothetical protein
MSQIQEKLLFIMILIGLSLLQAQEQQVRQEMLVQQAQRVQLGQQAILAQLAQQVQLGLPVQMVHGLQHKQ